MFFGFVSTVINKVAANILVHVFWWNKCSYFSGRFIGGILLGSKVLYLQFGRYCQMVFQSGGFSSVFTEKGVADPAKNEL